MNKVVLSTLVFGLTVLASTKALAETSSEAVSTASIQCSEIWKKAGAVEYRVSKRSSGLCWHSLSPINRDNLIYRDYLLESSGMIMIFASYGHGNDSVMAGAREIFLFPSNTPVNSTLKSDGVHVTFSNGMSGVYSLSNARWMKVKGGTITENNSPKWGDNGGWEIHPQRGVVLDFGFRYGASPMSNKKGVATFTDARGETCLVANNEIVTWSGKDPRLTFSHDADVKAFLAERCPALTTW